MALQGGPEETLRGKALQRPYQQMDGGCSGVVGPYSGTIAVVFAEHDFSAGIDILASGEVGCC